MQEADFTETVLLNSKFDNCDLSKTVFDRTNLENVNFSSAYNFSINPEENKLKGATFNKNNVVGLLSKYEIIIE